ncbi:MAG: glycine dehydrogenase (aminomethyl-transferring), partial [Proteobacteria bacterium]|nr:glycine dehydrogenase (aminomethyl-transferring) [Pseudomonadota bacterium]
HLAPFLPRNPIHDTTGGSPVSAAPFGSPSILPISWAYIAMSGASGLTKASKVAILTANYMADRLKDHYTILYTGKNGRVAHECIIDVRSFDQSAHVSVEDIAKRLIDYGFHAPTMSWPVSGTLMVEPTESEPLLEIDRFIDAMISIRKEIAEIEQGQCTIEDSPLRNAPHTAEQIAADEWPHPYSRMKAVYPSKDLLNHKYWPSVQRVNNTYGERNIACSCYNWS